MTRFHNSRPCNGTATHSNELSETLGMPKCQPAPARVLLSKSMPYPSPSPGVLDTDVTCSAPVPTQSTRSAHTFCWPDHAASWGSLWHPHLQPHPLSGRSGKPAGRKRNQCTCFPEEQVRFETSFGAFSVPVSHRISARGHGLTRAHLSAL